MGEREEEREWGEKRVREEERKGERQEERERMEKRQTEEELIKIRQFVWK